MNDNSIALIRSFIEHDELDLRILKAYLYLIFFDDVNNLHRFNPSNNCIDECMLRKIDALFEEMGFEIYDNTILLSGDRYSLVVRVERLNRRFMVILNYEMPSVEMF